MATSTAATARAAVTTTCDVVGGVSALPKHPQDASGLSLPSARTTKAVKPAYDAATATARAGDGWTTATSPSSASAAARARTHRARSGARTGTPAARSARTSDSGSRVFAAPATRSSRAPARYGAVAASIVRTLTQQPENAAVDPRSGLRCQPNAEADEDTAGEALDAPPDAVVAEPAGQALDGHDHGREVDRGLDEEDRAEQQGRRCHG